MTDRAFSTTVSLTIFIILFWLALIIVVPNISEAGKASTGSLLWFPCDRCHPIGTKPIPPDFDGHQVVLNGHDQLGQNRAACIVCHNSADRNPGLLKLSDGSLINIDGDVSQVCYQCHSSKYREWKAGIHGKLPKCTTGGCHDPHTPSWIAVSPLLPYLGTTLEVKIASERVAFKALPPPPSPPPTPSLPLLRIMTSIGLLTVIALFIAPVILRRFRR